MKMQLAISEDFYLKEQAESWVRELSAARGIPPTQQLDLLSTPMNGRLRNRSA